MAARLQLQIVQATAGTFTFDVEGEWTPRLEPVYRAATEPPQLEQILYTWEFRACRLVTSTGAPAALDASVAAFFATFEDEEDHPTYVRLVRDPSGAATEVLRLGTGGSDTYEGLRFALIEGEQDPQNPDASWSASATFTIEVSASRKFADANGIVGFTQEVRTRYVSGLRVLEWDTTITTAEGVSAVDKAKSFAAIDISSLPTYSYETNGPDGIEWEALDADESASRTPTVVQAISRVREWGVVIGASGGGAAPDEVSLDVTTTTSADGTTVATEAFARGPNAEQWVLSQRPAGGLASSIVTVSTAKNEARATWETNSSAAGVGFARTVTITTSGGGRALRMIPIAGGHPPIVQRGGFAPFKAEVAVRVTRQGGDGTAAELKFPPLLPAPWILDPIASKESDPYIAQLGPDESAHLWERTASLVYMAATRPAELPGAAIANGNDVTTYLLGA